MSAVPQPSFSQKNVVVQHHEGNTPTVDQVDITLDRLLGDELQWSCDHPGKKFRIDFGGRSPFERSTFDDQNYQSGPIRPDAHGPYKYSVEIDGKINDPRVIIQP
jgi:hypothetical protein